MIKHPWTSRYFRLVACAGCFWFASPVFSQTTLTYTADDLAYRTGLELLDKEKYGAAQKAFQDYIDLGRTDYQSIDARYYVAISALNLSNADAEPMIERFIANHPEHPKALLAYYELGNYYFAQKKYDKAIEYFKKVDTRQLNSEQRTETEFRLAYAYFTKQQFAEAGKLFDSLKRSQNKYTYAASYYAGYIAYRDGKYDQALVDLKKAAESEEYRPLIPYLIANVYYKQRRYDELVAYASEFSNDKSVRNVEEIQLLAGEAYYQQGDYAKAAPYFTQYAAGSRTKPAADVQYRMAYAQYKARDFENAVENFKPVASGKDTLSQYGAYYLGLSYLQTGNKPFAITSFDQARKGKFSPELAEEAAFYHAKVNYDQGNNTEAVVALKDFLKTYPNSKHQSEANEILGEAYLLSNNFAEALAHLESIKNRTPRLNAAYQRVTYNRGVELFNNEKFTEATPLFQKSLQNAPSEDLKIAAHFWSGEAYSANRQFAEAISQYEAVLREPKAAATEYQLKSRYGVGYAYYNKSEYGKALEQFREYVNRVDKTNRNYNDALLRLADCNYVTKNYAEAVRLYDQVIARNTPDKDYALFQKGVVLGLTNRNEEAKRTFDQVSTQYPNSNFSDNALFQKAQLDFESGAYQEAISGFSKLINQKKNSSVAPYALQKRALAYNNLKNYDQAIADYRTVIVQYPAHKTATDALLGLQQALASAGRSEEFDQYLTKYKEVNPQSGTTESVEFEAAKNLYFTEKYDKAIVRFNEYLRQYPNNTLSADAKYYLGESYNRLNDRANAREFYGQVISERKSQFTGRAISRLADLELAAGNFPAATNYYNLMLALAKNKKDQFNAWTGLVDAYYGQQKYDSVRYVADEIIKTGSATLSAQNKALLYKGKVAFEQENYDLAIDEFLKTLNSAQDENGAEAQYLMGESLYKKKEYKQSLDVLFALNKNFAAYEKWRGKGFLLIAENYVSLNENFQAKATLQSIIDNSPDKELVTAARNRLKALETTEAQQQAAESEEEMEAEQDSTEYQ